MDNAGPFVKKGGKLQFCDLAREAYLFRLLAVYPVCEVLHLGFGRVSKYSWKH